MLSVGKVVVFFSRFVALFGKTYVSFSQKFSGERSGGGLGLVVGPKKISVFAASLIEMNKLVLVCLCKQLSTTILHKKSKKSQNLCFLVCYIFWLDIISLGCRLSY